MVLQLQTELKLLFTGKNASTASALITEKAIAACAFEE
ncbi:MAG: hypothetical protein ACI8UO_001276 [Verrucomicrobiales bacterium]